MNTLVQSATHFIIQLNCAEYPDALCWFQDYLNKLVSCNIILFFKNLCRHFFLIVVYNTNIIGKFYIIDWSLVVFVIISVLQINIWRTNTYINRWYFAIYQWWKCIIVPALNNVIGIFQIIVFYSTHNKLHILIDNLVGLSISTLWDIPFIT